MIKTTLKDKVVSNCEIASLLGGHWRGRDPNSTAEFFNDDNRLIATRNGWDLMVQPDLVDRVARVCQ